MHDLMMLIMGCGGGTFSDVPTNPAQIFLRRHKLYQSSHSD